MKLIEVKAPRMYPRWQVWHWLDDRTRVFWRLYPIPLTLLFVCLFNNQQPPDYAATAFVFSVFPSIFLPVGHDWS